MENPVEQQLGNYRLTRLLARGGFAEVYLAQHIYLQSLAAIKVLQTSLSEEDMHYFLTEARTVVNLIHPNIIRVLEFGMEGDTPFLVMDYAPNGSLRQRYPKGARLPRAEIIANVRQIAGALQYAHDRRLIHRDIKPDNILLGRNNELLISDFGIAVLAHTSLSAETLQGAGTVSYMAPEQMQGKPRPASDQYALAIMVYEWLCGERPFNGTLTEITTQHLHTPPPPLRAKAPEVPPAVEEVIMTALAKDPSERYPSIMAFANALESAWLTEAFMTPQSPQSLIIKSTDATFLRPTPSSITSKVPRTGEETPHVPLPDGRKLLFSVPGLLLYILFSNLVIHIHLPSSQNNNVLWLLPALIIPIAYGLTYGPWIGLLIGWLGYFLGSFIIINFHAQTAFPMLNPIMLSTLHLPWYFNLGFLSLGIVAGIASTFTKGRYRSLSEVAIAELFSMAAIFVGFCIVLNSFLPKLYPYQTFLLDLTHIALPNIAFVLILLPIVLIIHNLFLINRDKQVRS